MRDRGKPTRQVVIEDPSVKDTPARRATTRRERTPRKNKTEGSSAVRLQPVQRASVKLRSVRRTSGVRLRSAAPERQAITERHQQVRRRLAIAAAAIRQGQKQWSRKRFHERKSFTASLRDKVPRGTAGDTVLRQLPDECSTCDERFHKQKVPARVFANKRLEQRREAAEEFNAKLDLKRYRWGFKKPAKQKLEEEPEEENAAEDPDRDPDEPDYGGGSDNEPPDAASCTAVAAN